MGLDGGLDQRLDPQTAVHRVGAQAAYRIPTSVEIRGARLVGAVLSLVVFFIKTGFTGCGGRNKHTFLTNVSFIVREFDLGLYSKFSETGYSLPVRTSVENRGAQYP